MLDEPTNHLDMESIAWLETYLLNYPGSVIIVAHDRYFLDRVVTKIVELDNKKSTVFQGNYTAYSEKKAMLRANILKAYLNQQQEIRHQEEVIAKLKSFNREKSIKRAESREKMLSKMENMISMMATEKPFERLQSLEQKINEVDKIQTIENYIAQLKERIWAVKEVLTTAEASAYLGLSESYIYKLTSLKQIPHYKPNGKLVYFNRKELCEWAMRNQVQTIGQPAAITREEL